MKQVKLYTPHANQRIIHQHPARNRVVTAGRRFGKSALGLNEAIARASLLKNQIVWIILPLYRQAKEIYWIDPDITAYFMPLVQAGAVKADKSELSLHFKNNNSWIRIKGSDNYDSLRGSGIDLIIWDEVADVKEEAFDTIEPALADSPNHRQLFIGTPKGLNWFHDFALYGDHDKVFPDFGKVVKPRKDWMSWHFTSYDNAAWPEGSKRRKTFVNYIDEKKDEAEEKGRLAFWEQEYMASFSEGAGRFFPVWSYKTHVQRGRVVPVSGSVVWESMDWGRTAPFAWYAHIIESEIYIDSATLNKYEFTRVFTFAELYGSGKSPKEWVGEIVKKRKEYDIVETKQIAVDPSMFNPLSDGSLSIVDQMQEQFRKINGKNERFVRGSRNRKSRWSAMDDWMRTAVDGMPYWMITDDCKNLIEEIPLQEPDENDLEDLNTDLRDHACFFGKTKVLTDKGNVFIKDIKAGDKIVTPFGLDKVVNSGCTGVEPMVKYKIEHQEIICTKDHPFITQQGIYPIHQIALSGMVKNIIGMDIIWQGEEENRDCIMMFGYFIRKGKSLKGIISIMLTAIPVIIVLKTYGLFLQVITVAIIQKSYIKIKSIGRKIKSIWKKSGYLLLSGIGQKVEELGINDTTRIIKTNFTKNGKRNVIGVEKHLLPEISRQSFANLITVIYTGIQQELIIRSASARFAENLLSSINIKRIKHAVNIVQEYSPQEVYNIKTEKYGMYFANGFLVSNCDSVSYFLPFIKWTDSIAGGVKRSHAVKRPAKFQHMVSLDKFAR